MTTQTDTPTEVGPGRPEKTDFDRALEGLVISETQETLHKIDRLARQHGVDDRAVYRAIDRFSGSDLAECWAEFGEY